MQRWGERQSSSDGFTLIELLVAIVVVGILTAVAIVGIAGLRDRGATSACTTSMDAANAATLAYYSNSGGNYPQNFAQLTNPATGQPMLNLTGDVVSSPTVLTGNGWALTMQPGATITDKTTFSGC